MRFNISIDLPTDPNDPDQWHLHQRCHYSNYGPGVEICAPSSNSHAYFRMQLDGLGIVLQRQCLA